MANELAYEGSDESSENELLEKSLSVWRGWNVVDREDFAPVPLDLHTACSIGQYDTVRSFILKKEEDLNKKNKGGWTPLMYACYIGHDNIVNLLLEASVDVNCKNLKGQTPLMLAASCGNESVGYFLCQQGAELEAQDKKGWTALFHATYSGHQNMVKFLLEQGSNMNAIEPSYGITPFMEAAAEGHEIIVQMFLQHGVNVNAKAFSGDMARSLALMKGHMKIVSLIDNHMIQAPLRSEPGLFADLSSSDEGVGPSRPHGVRTKGRPKGPSIRDGPEGFARYLDRSRYPEAGLTPTDTYIPNGYVTFNNNQSEGENADVVQIRSRDVTSPISANDHTLDSSVGKDSLDNDEDWNSFSKTGALTIKSNSSSSGGLAAALGISRDNSLDSNEGDGPSSDDSSAEQSPPSHHNTQQDQSDVPCQRTPADGANRQDECPPLNLPSPQLPGHLMPQFASQTVNQMPPWPSEEREYTLFSHGQRADLERGGYLNPAISPPVSDGNLVSDMWGMQINPTPTCISDVTNGMKQSVTCTSGSSNSRVPCRQLATETMGNAGRIPVLDKPGKGGIIQQSEGRPTDLSTLLEQIGMSQYKKNFFQQDVDLQVFLSLTENDLQELGVQLFGHRRKMTIAIARWHSNAKLYMNNLEQVYANKLEADMQEMAIKLHKVVEQNDRLKAQVLQERELRSVTESCLMEERAAWQHTQHLVRDTRQCCDHLTPVFRKLRYQQFEVKRRSLPEKLLWEDANTAAQDSVLSNYPYPENNSTQSVDDLFWKIDYFLKHLEQNVDLIKRNTERLLGSQPPFNIPPGAGGVA